MKCRAGTLLVVAALAATAVVSGHAAPKAAAPFSFSLDLGNGAFTAAPPQWTRAISYQGYDVLVAGQSVATLPHPVMDVAGSADGRLVAAVTYDASVCGKAPPPPCGDFAIWVMNRDGSGLRLFSADARDPAWSPDSRRLAFVGGFDTATLTGMVSVADADGAHRRALGAREPATGPAWAAGGALLAYTRVARHESIRVVRVADARVVATLDRAGGPTWAGSGPRLAFVRQVQARNALTLWSNGRLRVLATTAPGMTTLSWSPDGRRIAFARDGASAEIGVARVDRNGPRMFRLPYANASNGADVTDILWKGADALFVTGRFYGILGPR